MFKAFYSKSRFNYIDSRIKDNRLFVYSGGEIIPKTACFFSNDLDVYIDTSDGVNDDLKIQEYCGRILSCIRMSKGKKFVFFKAAYSNVWSQQIEQLAVKNNGKVKPFFKWSFNPDFYKHAIPNLKYLRSLPRSNTYDVGLFADFGKQYEYPKPSSSDPRISHSDHSKFNLQGQSANTGMYTINSRPEILNKIESSKLTCYAKSLNYEKYIQASMECSSILNPPGIGEYTSRMMDQTALGNLIILRKNTYDNGNSWKDYIPEIDFSNDNWVEEYQQVMDDSDLWKEKSLYYYEKLWSPEAVFRYFIDHIREEL